MKIGKNTAEQIERVIALVEQYGCIEYAEGSLQSKALKASVTRKDSPSAGRDILAEMLDFLVARFLKALLLRVRFEQIGQ